MTLLGILAFVVALLLSVMLHEAGHFFTARRYGMKATHFFVGFGPTLWSRTKGETEYGVKAVPAGGFVKIVGMTPLEEVEPGDEDRAFYKQKAGRKTVVLAAGSTVHFVICVVLVFGSVLAFGVDKQTAPSLATVNDCVGDVPVSYCGLPGADTAPSKAAGLKAGDVVTSANGTRVDSADSLTSVIKASADRPVVLTVRRDGKPLTVRVTPASVTRPGTSSAVGAIGVTVQQNYTKEHYGPVAAVSETGVQLKTLVTSTYDTLTKKLDSISRVYSDDRDPAGFVGVVGAARVGGEIAAAEGVSFADKLNAGILLIAGLNLFVGIFNLLPLLPLDGGHIAVVWFEAVRDRFKRARGYVGEVVRVDYNKLMPLTFAVVALFVGFTVWILGADIVNPIRIGG